MTDTRNLTPQSLAVQAIFQNANAGDRTPDVADRADMNGEAARLCRRAADELDSRPD